MYIYTTKGVCPSEIRIELDGSTVKHIEFIGGCNGNLKAISKIVSGMDIDNIADLFEGNTCGVKPTSCVDQLVIGLREAYFDTAERDQVSS